MHRRSRLFLCATLAMLPAAASAQSSRSFDVCGGSFTGVSVLGLCAAANVTVALINNQPTVTMQVWNLSGSNSAWEKSNAWTTLVAVGLTNIIPQTVNVVNNSLKVTGPCAANPAGCDYSQYWWMGNNVGVAGLVIDLLAVDARGGGIVSTCDPNNPLITRSPYLYTSCTAGGPNVVTMTFNTNEMFNLANGGDLFLKGQYHGELTYCVTGNQTQPSCVPMTAAPEPGTLALLGSGLASFGGFGFMRRRRKEENEEA